MEGEQSAALKAEFPWMTGEGVDYVMDELGRTRSAGNFKAQMESIAHCLTDMGLVVGPRLLLRLAGGGSNSTATRVVMEQMQRRFDRHVERRAISIPGLHAPELVSNCTTTTMTHPDERLFVYRTSAHISDQTKPPPEEITPDPRTAEIMEQMLGTVQLLKQQFERVDGNIAWLKSTIDTERQLRKYMEQKGPLPEPSPTQRTADVNRRIINNLSQQLSEDYSGRGELAKPGRSAPQVTDRFADHEPE